MYRAQLAAPGRPVSVARVLVVVLRHAPCATSPPGVAVQRSVTCPDSFASIRTEPWLSWFHIRYRLSPLSCELYLLSSYRNLRLYRYKQLVASIMSPYVEQFHEYPAGSNVGVETFSER